MNMKKIFGFCIALFFAADLTLFAADKKIVLIAGRPSHGPGEHEHNAGVLLLKKCLDDVPGIKAEVHLNGWPEDEKIFDGADAIVLYMDGGSGHAALQEDRLQKLNALMKKGVGLACLHYGVEPTIEKGEKEFLDWIGGAFEINWSVNPHWDADFTNLPKHPITRGVKPFKINDEWYFNMRFRDGMKGVTPILIAIPTPDTTSRKDGTHDGNPVVRDLVKRGVPQTVAWAATREDGGRGFGFTGAHNHKNWGDENFRKIVLNGILWIAKADVPKNGVECKVTEEDLKKNLDPKGEKKAAAKVPVAPTSAAEGPKPKFKSGIMKSGRVAVDVDISGAKGLWLVVTDGGNGIECDWADWIEPSLIRTDGSIVNLTSLKWKTATSGFGTAGINKNANGGPLMVEKKKVEDGIGAHAPSVIEYEFSGDAFARFTAKAGLDDGGVDQGCGTQVEFLVFTEKPSEAVLQTTSESAGRGYGFEAAKEMLKTVTLADGLEATLFAAEPMVRNPTDIDIDARGRVWVCEGVNYRHSIKPWGILQKEGDRILILEDTDGDGVADSAKTFFQGPEINAALGICVLGHQVFVSCSPNIFVLTDTDGDDKADKKEVLFSGIGGVDHDHGVHAMVFGPDGKLYFNFGNEGHQIKDKDGKLLTDIEGNLLSTNNSAFRQGMTFRCNLDGSGVEVLGHNFRNPYEVTVDSFGTIWQSDNDDDGNRAVRINYVMQHGNYGFNDEMTGAAWKEKRTNLEKETPLQHWHQNDPGVVPNLLITGAGAPTGIAFYEGTLLPKKFQNQMIHCDAGTRVVRSYAVKPEGAGYKTEINDILSTSDMWFRPSDVCIAPDGSIYVSDWNDSGVGGHNMADHELKTMKGRIYRIAPKGNKPSVAPLDFTTVAGSASALKSPNMATRYLAWDELNALGGKAENELLKLWKSDDQAMRGRALQLLMRIKGKEKKYLEQALRDKNPDLCIAGLRIAQELNMDLIPSIKKLVKSSNPQIRRECALALRHNRSREAARLWAELAVQHDGKDRWYLESLGLGADQQEDEFFAAWLNLSGTNWNTPAGHDIIWRSRSSEAPAYLTKIILDPNTSEMERDRCFRALDFLKGNKKQMALVSLLNLAAP